MWLILCSAFALFSSVQVSATSSVAVSPAIANAVCHQDETSCGNSCCPYPNAMCCNETQSCCRQGSVCLGSISYCLGLKQNGLAPTLYSEKSIALRVEACPSGTTTCSGGCCPFPDAVCCPDGLTCCPEGTVCDPSGICLGGENVATRFLKSVLNKSYNVPSINNVNDCPSGTTTCSGGCCPFPDAVCCPDGLTCCPEGTVCDPSGICLGGKNVATRFLKLVLSKSYNVPSINNVNDCPSGTTTCSGGCCSFPDAVCCPDGLTCCPEGTVCDSTGICLGGENGATHIMKSVLSKSYKVKSINNVDYCPSGMTTCSSGCCPLPNAVCCPDGLTCCPEGSICDPSGSGFCLGGGNVAARSLKAVRKSYDVPVTKNVYNFPRKRDPFIPKAGADCCNAWFGHICCSMPMPWCTFLGCV